MDFRLDETQIEVQQTVSRYCSSQFGTEELAAAERRAVDRTRWTGLADLGIFGLLLPEASGGSGLGVAEAVICFEQLGSHLVPGPLLWTVLGAAASVDGASSGDALVGGLDLVANPAGPFVVERPDEIDALLILHPDRVVIHTAREHGAGDLPVAAALDPLDPLTPVGAYDTLPAGTEVGGPDMADRLRVLGTVLGAALLLGLSARALDVARTHALEREQFGAPIGSFQAVKHLLADMYVRTALAQSATYAAAAVLDDPGSDHPRRAASGAKLLAADAALTNAGTAIQVLGGMGFTWEMLPNLLLKRAWVLEQEFGTIDDHAGFLGTSAEAPLP